MNRRNFLKTMAAASTVGTTAIHASLPPAKITKIKIFHPPTLNQTFNQSNVVVTVETDIGITGIGEGGTKDLIEQCAGNVIGKNPFHIEALWQEMYIAWFYPPGREKIHALGAIDLALWDIKAKALKVPLHELIGGVARNYCECYATGGVPVPQGTSLKDRAKAAIDAGYRAFRTDAGIGAPMNEPFDTRQRVKAVIEACQQIREGVGPKGDWCIDTHQKFDYADSLRICKGIEQFDPYFVEDPVKDEQFFEDIPKMRQMTSVPIAAGEEWGQRWNFNKLVENHDIDFNRCTIPNVGGITEYLKVMSMCETHTVGMVPHFTGPISTAALVHCLVTYSGNVLFEYNYGNRPIDYLPEFVDFKNGKLYPNLRTGLGVTLDEKPLKLVGEVTKPGTARIYRRPDGSLTHW